ncbi:hypothetical protein ACHQM5_002245 [Ranunculus cassubicifolius]
MAKLSLTTTFFIVLIAFSGVGVKPFANAAGTCHYVALMDNDCDPSKCSNSCARTYKGQGVCVGTSVSRCSCQYAC